MFLSAEDTPRLSPDTGLRTGPSKDLQPSHQAEHDVFLDLGLYLEVEKALDWFPKKDNNTGEPTSRIKDS